MTTPASWHFYRLVIESSDSVIVIKQCFGWLGVDTPSRRRFPCIFKRGDMKQFVKMSPEGAVILNKTKHTRDYVPFPNLFMKTRLEVREPPILTNNLSTHRISLNSRQACQWFHFFKINLGGSVKCYKSHCYKLPD